MIEAMSRGQPDALRVAVLNTAEAARGQLHRGLSEIGYIVVETAEAADVVISEDPKRATASDRFLLIQRADGAAASSLPPDLDLAQLDAAVWAVSVGLVVRARETQSTGFGQWNETETRDLLTPREFEILQALSQGLSNKAIARKLEISLHTVKFHVESVFRKLGARNRTEAVAKAHEQLRDQTIDL